MAFSTNNEQNRQNFVIENDILKGAVHTIDSEHKLGQIILDALNDNLDHVSQIDAETGKQTTCREMKDQSIRCALWMKKMGISPNDIVVVCTHNHLESYVPVLATFFVDAIFSAWNYNLTIHTARRFIKQFSPAVIFTCEKAVDVLLEASKLEKSNVKLVVFGRHSTLPSLKDITNEQIKDEINDFTIVNVKSPKEVSLIILSSGSTGFPKGVMKSSSSILSSLLQTRAEVGLNILWYSTLEWTTGITFTLRSIIAKFTRIIPTICDVENFFEIVEKYKINRVFLPPVLTTHVAKSQLAQNYNLRSLKIVFNGGSKANKEVLESFRRNIPTAFICSLYGSTEIGMISNRTPACKHIESVGFIVANVEAKIVNLATGQSLGPNQHGEICAKSPAYMIGYYDNPEATKEACDEDGWHHTGDIGYYDENGEIFIVDRMKEIMKYQNNQISPVEIEEILLSHPDIQEAVVVALPHKLDGDWPTAFCKKTAGSKVTEEELMKLTSVLEDYKKLRGGIHFIDKFLYTASGKIARNEMKKLAVNNFQSLN